MGAETPSPGVKRQWREADHSLSSSAEVRNGGAKPPLPHMSSWHGAYLIKHRDNFTIYTTIIKLFKMIVFVKNKIFGFPRGTFRNFLFTTTSIAPLSFLFIGYQNIFSGRLWCRELTTQQHLTLELRIHGI
jgi:hypothetical protein